MNNVSREEILDYVTYEENRNEVRNEILKIKENRRINVGSTLSFLFENKDTVRYQIQEMIRVERIVKEKDIEHEIETYNELLGKPGELGCTLLIEIDDPLERDSKLSKWIDLPSHLYLKLDDESLVMASFDERQVGDSRLSSVQYIKFDTNGKVPIAIGSNHPLFSEETILSDLQKEALSIDLL